MKASRYESVGSESILLMVKAGRDVVFDVLQNQFPKALHQDGGNSHRVVIIRTSNRNDVGCLEAGENSLL